jgi:hypothetical protein
MVRNSPHANCGLRQVGEGNLAHDSHKTRSKMKLSPGNFILGAIKMIEMDLKKELTWLMDIEIIEDQRLTWCCLFRFSQ